MPLLCERFAAPGTTERGPWQPWQHHSINVYVQRVADESSPSRRPRWRRQLPRLAGRGPGPALRRIGENRA
eukprot:9573896-Alexandrium_andersonii.AAC.1